MPTYNSYFVSNFDNDVLELFRNSKPYVFYHRNEKSYEIMESIYRKFLKGMEHGLFDMTEPYEVFKRATVGEYGYQEDAVTFAKKVDSVLLAFSQGMGKTLTSFKIITETERKRTLVVCGQSNLQEEWLKDAIKHKMTDIHNVQIIGNDSGCGNVKKIKWLEETEKKEGVYLTNIEALRDKRIVECINNNEYDCIIVDEVQAAKGWGAEQTKGLQELIRYEGQKRLALSGTPVLNDPLEYFSMLKFLGALIDTVKTTFEAYYGEWSFDLWGNRKCIGYRHLEDLCELIRPVFCYADKSELNLPPKKRKKINLTWNETDEWKNLSKVYKLPIRRLKAKGYNSKPQIRAMMQLISSTTPEKIDFIKNSKGRRLVFSIYTSVLEIYETELQKAGLKVLYYHSGLNMKGRLKVLKDWSENKIDVLLLSELAARFGLNLTEATSTMFVEPPTSLAILEQCEDRAHRIGQTEEVTSYLLCSTKLDEDALTNIEQKQESIDKLKEMLRS